MNKGEINKYLSKTNFDEWLSDRGDADSLDIPTKKIEAELDKLVSLVYKNTKEQRLEDLVHTAKVFQKNETKKDAKKIIKQIQKEAKKMPKGFSGCGGMLCPSNPEFYERGQLDALNKFGKLFFGKISKGKRVLCIGCGKPIKIDEFGGLDNRGLFHNKVFCLMKADIKSSSNRNQSDKEVGK